MDIEYLEEPIWYQSAIALNVVFPFLAVIFSRWIHDARVVVAVPVVASTVAATYGMISLVTALQQFETAGWPTRAAGVATALVPVTMGAVVSAVMSGCVVFGPRSFATKRTRPATILMGLQAIACTAWAALAWLLVRPTVPSLDSLKAAAWTTFIFSGTALMVSLGTALVAKERPNAIPAAKRWFVLFVALAFTAAAILLWARLQLERDVNPMHTWRKNCACFETS
jgi:hypothetical protein